MPIDEDTYAEVLKRRQQLPQYVHGSKELREGRKDSLDRTYDEILERGGGAKALRSRYLMETPRNSMMQTEEMSILEKTLDYLSRGNYMAAEATLGILENEGFEDISKRSWAGLSGESKTSFIDVMDDVAGGRNPWVNIPIGFAADVILDPINLVPMAWPKAIGKMLGLPKLIKAADDVTHLSKTFEKTKHVVGDIPGINWMGKAFKPGYALRKHPGAYDLYRDTELKIASIKRNVREELEQRWDLFREAAKKLEVDAEWAAAEMIRGHEAGEMVGDVGKKLRELLRMDETLADPKAMQVLKDSYTDIVRGFEKMAKDEAAAGIMDPKRVIENYFPHIYEKGKLVQLPGGKWKAKGRYGFFTSMKYRGTPFHAKPREFASIEDAKNFLGMQKIKGYPIPVPVEHWFRGYAIRRFVGESAVAWKGFVDDALTKFGTPVTEDLTEVPKGFRLVMPTSGLRAPAARSLLAKMLKEGLEHGPGEMEKLLGQEGPNFLYHLFKKTRGKGLVIDVEPDMIKKLGEKNVYLMPTEVASHIKDSFKVFSTDAQVKGLLGGIDTMMHWWKSMATSMRLPFHHRNALSNTWLMYLGGVSVPKMPHRIAQAMKVQMKAKGMKFQGFGTEELNEIANRYGVRAFGWIAADVPRMFQRELFISTERKALARKLGSGVNPYNPLEHWSRVGRKYGTQIEDNARIALFMDQLVRRGITKETATPEALFDAAKHVKKYLFDYTELTSLERNVMKRVMPFYTWMRKNIPLQLESIVTKPHKFARLADVERDLFPVFTEPETPQQKAIRPKWLDEMRAMKMKDWTTEGGDPIYTWIDLPTSDLHKMQKLGKFLSSSVNPLMVLYQTAVNVRTWPKPGVVGKPGQKIVAPFYVQFLPQKDWKIMGIEPVRNRKTGKVVLGMDPQWKYALGTMFPFLNDWEAMHPGGVNMGIQREGELKPRAWSYLTGIKFKPIYKKDAALQKYFKIHEFQRNIRRAAKVQEELTQEEQREILRQTME
jgi:hypothetical protein